MTRDAAKGNTANAGNNVRTVSSNQTAIHDKLDTVVGKHLNSRFRKPIRGVSRDTFARAEQWLSARPRPVILDSFCGTGESTVWLAQQFPGHAVIGIDKSAARLQRHPQSERDNYLLLRADTDDLWRLVVTAQWNVEQHYLFYPNPWPKAEHLQRRCHGSPLFPYLLAIGGKLELRSNWRLYIEEFCRALALAGIEADAEVFSCDTAVTAFERKYALAGQILWRCRCQLPTTPTPPL